MKYKVVGHVAYEQLLVSRRKNGDVDEIKSNGYYYKILLVGIDNPHDRKTFEVSSDEMKTGLYDTEEIFDIKRFLLWQWIKHIDKGDINNETN